MDTGGINQLIGELRAVAASASSPAQQTQKPSGVDFGEVLKGAIDKVNTAKVTAEAKADAFSTDPADVNLHDVMIELQKANISFQQMIQVRNKLVSAFHEIMNMPV